MEETKNNKKGKLLYTLLGVTLLLALVGGAYAFFSASVSNNSIGGQTQNINNDSLTLTVKKVVFTGATAPSNDLVPAWFGYSSGTTLNNDDPSDLTEAQVGTMLTNKCVSDGFTGCHVYKITIQANQNITHANLLLNLSVSNLTGASNVVDKSQWGYVVFSATGTVDSSTGATAGLSNPDFNDNNGAPAAIGDGVTNLDIHNDGSLSTTEVIYYLLVYVNDTGESQNSVSSNTGDENYAVGTYSGSLELQALGGKVRTDFGPQMPQGQNAAQYITSLYTNAEKSQVTTLDEITYNLAPIFGSNHDEEDEYIGSSGLMNDRLGGNTTLDGGNIRYYGANPNNYVWLGDTYTSGINTTSYEDYEECIEYEAEEYCTENIIPAGTKKLWRIIGVFDGRLKLIQADSIGSYSWDESDSEINDGYGVNQWGPSPADGTGYEGADLMRQLNPGFDNAENGSWYWNNGLSAEERSMIDTVTWYLGTNDDPYVPLKSWYNAERQSSVLGCSSNCDDNVTRTATWTGKVGLMYPSDYGYATDLSKCNQYITDYNYQECFSNDWLFFNGPVQWTITPCTASLGFGLAGVMYVDAPGVVNFTYASTANYVRPVIYLNTNVMIDIDGNDGSESNPYVLSLS